jgi:hypothetical protein
MPVAASAVCSADTHKPMGRVRQKQCDRCQGFAAQLYRVQLDASREWQFVCDRCWPKIRDNNPYYTYGGTWKARKRH